MAQLKFYKKLRPDTKVALSGNTAVQFTTIDTLTGYYATDNEAVQNEFRNFMEQQKFGISEISAEEFTRDYVEKKTTSKKFNGPLSRETLGGPKSTSPHGMFGTDHVVAAVSVTTSDIPKSEAVPMVTPADASAMPAPEPLEPMAKPKIGKRA